ncbi:glycoside hydrolase [Vagococcus sp. BWB3-3]|uniref:Glycoside hydrolase n=1 Tax=Vagococcus allomyrinae TaxID=2794353 RepID=A0A940PCK9_9ENTE|nr:glycoside hydrolase family 76 protein [Vagococcus allomyrinae]MBP1041016.1 glycoside hydrolase [Vagococcus allomyrinae]
MTINWAERANQGQKSLTYFYASTNPTQLLNNVYPFEDDQENAVFNYWWLAHTVDVKVDAYLRTGNQLDLAEAEAVYDYNKTRNHGSLIHDYYDDMLWNALAALRLYTLTAKAVYLEDALTVWQDHVDTGWNEICGGGFAWRKPQMDYKNTPVNAPFIILSNRLYRILGERKYLDWSYKTFDWLTNVLVREDGFVEDGINRQGDGQIDHQWQFTYNQGVYIGACLAFYEITKDYQYVRLANQNAQTTIKLLSDGKIFKEEGEGGDEGLFKGIFYRYFADLAAITHDQSQQQFIEAGAEILVTNGLKDQHLLMGMDWYHPTVGKIPFSAQLSGIMILEMMAKLTK